MVELGPAPEPSEYFSALPGATLQVPRVDDDAQPIGGVRFPDVELPLGRAEPVALPPCGASSITDGCGNFGGWKPFTASELAERYGTVDDYAEQYAAFLDGFVADGFVLPRDRDGVIKTASASSRVPPELTGPRVRLRTPRPSDIGDRRPHANGAAAALMAVNTPEGHWMPSKRLVKTRFASSIALMSHSSGFQACMIRNVLQRISVGSHKASPQDSDRTEPYPARKVSRVSGWIGFQSRNWVPSSTAALATSTTA